VNSLGEELMKEFEELYTKFSGDPAAQAAVLISGKPGCFIAGADIKVHTLAVVPVYVYFETYATSQNQGDGTQPPSLPPLPEPGCFIAGADIKVHTLAVPVPVYILNKMRPRRTKGRVRNPPSLSPSL
jgi:hypothetical protein